MYVPATECCAIGIEVSAIPYTPKPKPAGIPEKWLAIMKKYKVNWRLSMLATPKHQMRKYIRRPVEMSKPWFKRVKKLPEEIRFYSEQQARAPLRRLVINKGLWSKQNGRRYFRRISKYIHEAWDSIYNYYKKRARDRRLRQLRRDKELMKGKKKKVNEEILKKLATPKKIFRPPPRPKGKKFKDFIYIEHLATPKNRPEIPEREIGVVKPSALTYNPTAIILGLAPPRERYKDILPPKEIGLVPRGALKYKITDRMKTLAEPKKRTEQKIDEDWDPWAISKTALKYKPTARILELSKPLERD